MILGKLTVSRWGWRDGTACRTSYALKLSPALHLLFVLLCVPISSQENAGISWRTNYAQARQEAREKQLPLLLDFTTEWCVHCQRMDATTFQDATVMSLLSKQFIPVKIDAAREQALVEALRIRGYPTLVLALPDGRIVHTLEGYHDAHQLTHYLRNVLAQLGPSTHYVQYLEEALKQQSAGEYAKAVAILKSLLNSPDALAVHARARSALEQIEQIAHGEWEAEKAKASQRSSEEGERSLRALAERFAGTAAAREIEQALAEIAQARQAERKQRQQQAATLLVAAQEDLKHQNWLACLERCDRLLRDFADLPEAKQAQALLEKLKAEPERMQQTCDRLTERLGELHLTLAESWLRQGEPQLAIATYRKVATMFVGTRFAEIAQLRLQQLADSPFQQTQFAPQ